MATPDVRTATGEPAVLIPHLERPAESWRDDALGAADVEDLPGRLEQQVGEGVGAPPCLVEERRADDDGRQLAVAQDPAHGLARDEHRVAAITGHRM
ncbi:MAG TPA: hypothetical protein VIJ41_12270 [Candidatus Nanopelagicales bacterium]